MQIVLTKDEEAAWEQVRKAIGASTVTAAIRAVGVMFAAVEKRGGFRDDVIAASARMNVTKDGRLPE